ncbi:tRNA1(Val) (adenine(37)-N6)-methyltransferase [Candidatus Hepatincola sp. Pdp]
MDKGTLDLFLSGKVRAYQHPKGYRSGTDAVLLASIINNTKQGTCLEIGCGVGVASLCLAARLPNMHIIGLEKQEDFFHLACKNAELNNFPTSSFQPLLGNILTYKFTEQFQVVFANPPYYVNKEHKKEFTLKEMGNMETDATLGNFIDFAFKSLKNHGYLYIIQSSERFQEMMQYFTLKHWGNIEIFPIYSYNNKPATRFILKAKKIGNNISTIHNGIIMHNDDKTYSNHAVNILKHGKSFFYNL